MKKTKQCGLTHIGMTLIRTPIPSPATKRATKNIVKSIEPPDNAAPIMVRTAPIWMVYLRENRSADQALNTAPTADAAEQTPRFVSGFDVIGNRVHTVHGANQICSSFISRLVW